MNSCNCVALVEVSEYICMVQNFDKACKLIITPMTTTFQSQFIVVDLGLINVFNRTESMYGQVISIKTVWGPQEKSFTT